MTCNRCGQEVTGAHTCKPMSLREQRAKEKERKLLEEILFDYNNNKYGLRSLVEVIEEKIKERT